MQVSKNAWHYKILMQETKTRIRYGTSLCKYFWLVVFAMFAWSIIGVFATLAAIGVGFIAYWLVYIWYFMVAGGLFGVESFSIDSLHMSFAVHALIIGVWIMTIIQRLYYKFKKRPKTDNLAFKYIKAKKQKICPIIEFKG